MLRAKMDANCLAYGFVISLIVSVLKRVPFVRNNAKVIAFVLSSIAPLITAAMAATGHATSVDYATLAVCIGSQFATSVATHEVIANTFAAMSRGDRVRGIEG